MSNKDKKKEPLKETNDEKATREAIEFATKQSMLSLKQLPRNAVVQGKPTIGRV